MQGNNHINHRPYLPALRKKELERPYICRLAPFSTGFELEWLNPEGKTVHSLWYSLRDCDKKYSVKVSGTSAKIEGLQKDCEYEFYVEADDGSKSNLRYVRTGDIPEGCIVVNYLHPEDKQYDFSGQYLCSPSLVRVKSGRLIAGMDLFGHAMPQNLTVLFYSDDDGDTWNYLTDLYPFFWSNLFCYNDVLYILGLSTEYGNLQIACSRDEGLTWSAPVTLFYGSNRDCLYGGMHRAPMQVVEHKGRLYTTCEYGNWLTVGYHLPAILSIDAETDLMQPENWHRSEFLKFEGEWKEKAGVQGDTIEGNIVEGPDGNLYSFMRWKLGSMLKLRVNTENPDAKPEFVDIVEAPVSNSMFRIFKTDNKYLMLTNRKSEEAAKFKSGIYRSVLSLCESDDLEHFEVVKEIVDYGKVDPERVGFQYPAFLYEDKKLYVTIRSSFNNARCAHDSNYILFRKL